MYRFHRFDCVFPDGFSQHIRECLLDARGEQSPPYKIAYPALGISRGGGSPHSHGLLVKPPRPLLRILSLPWKMQTRRNRLLTLDSSATCWRLSARQAYTSPLLPLLPRYRTRLYPGCQPWPLIEPLAFLISDSSGSSVDLTSVFDIISVERL